MLKEFGKDLKSLRESRNITIAEISSETRINSKFFLNIEAGKFDFQPETYVRAFLKEYARCIGENETQILHDYELAKTGFYDRKSGLSDDSSEDVASETPPEETVSQLKTQTSDYGQETPPHALESKGEGEYHSPAESYQFDNLDFSGLDRKNRIRRRMLLGLLFIIIAGGVIFLISYLNRPPGDGQSSEVKPKSFAEISEDYENKMKGRDTQNAADTVKNPSSLTPADSMVLTIKPVRDIRIKIYLDEDRIVEDVIYAGDSLSLKANDQFRFSATANSSIDLYLNGELLRKPSTLTGTSIKNLIIRKDGIVTE
jgi:cytoskeletal protein RodZ